MPDNTNKDNPMKQIFMRILFVVGIVLAIALLVFVLVRILPPFFSFIGNSLSSIWRNDDNNGLTVTSSRNTINSGESFTLTWEAATTTTSSSITVACAAGLNTYYIGSQNTKIPVPCGREFKIGGTVNNATLEARLQKADSYSDVDIEVRAMTSEGSTLSGKTVVTVNSTGSLVTVSTSTPTNTNRATSTTLTPSNSNNWGNGYIPKPAPNPFTGNTSTGGTYANPTYTNNFANGTPADLALSEIYILSNNPVPVIAFGITNIGGTSSGNWILKVNLPNNQVFTSNILPSLVPGQTAEYTMSLGTITGSGNYSVVVVVDSENQVNESNENNNTREIKVSGNGGQGGVPTSGNKPDLRVEIIDTRDRGSDEWEVTFRVENRGGESARDWRFEAELPTRDNETYRSGEQSDLASGSYVDFTLRFDNAEDGDFEVEVDSEDDVNESSENNNTDRIRINN